MSHLVPFAGRILFIALVGVLFFSVGVLSEDQRESVSTPSALEPLTFYTEQLPPYNYAENGTAKGFTVDILEEISKRSGMNLSREDVQVIPWEDAYQAALTGNRTVLFSTARTPDRENTFKWVGPISMERYVLFSTQDSTLSVNNSTDLKNLRIGAITGDASIQLLLGEGASEDQLVTVPNVTELITKLETKDIDLWAYPEFTGRYYTEQVTGDYYAFNISYPLGEVGIYYAFSRDVPDSTIESFQKSLDALKEEKDDAGVSMYERILERYVPHPGSGIANI